MHFPRPNKRFLEFNVYMNLFLNDSHSLIISQKLLYSIIIFIVNDLSVINMKVICIINK